MAELYAQDPIAAVLTQIAHLTDRAVLRIGGADARGYLQDMLTNDVDGLAPGAPLWAGLLSAQGKVLFDMILHADGETVLVDVAAVQAAALAQRLAMYRLRRAVTIAAATLPVHAAWSGRAGEQPLDPRLPALGQRWIGDATPNCSGADYDAHRLALGVADSGDLLIDKMLWLEANAVELHGVSFTKGCYVGQENTARMHHRDKLRRRLLPVDFAGATGDGVIWAGDSAAGELRSHAGHRGIAYLRLDPVEAGTPLTMNGAPLTVVWPAWLPR